MKTNHPCIGLCTTSLGDDTCKGCHRTSKEVIEWNKFTQEQKEVVLKRIKLTNEDLKLNKLTPEQYLKLAVLAVDARWQKEDIDMNMSGDQVDSHWDHLVENDRHWDSMGEIRGGQFETGLPTQLSRHYESKAVAMKINDQWVGWTYWYGGGKHGEPEGIDWMNEAYFLDCEEKQELVTVRKFTVNLPPQQIV